MTDLSGGDVSGAEGAHRRLILVSNRGPIVHHREDGQRLTRRGGGGLVTALTGLAADLIDAVWVCAAMTSSPNRCCGSSSTTSTT